MNSKDIEINMDQKQINKLSNSLLKAHDENLYKRVDYIFALIFIIQWIGGIAAAFIISPRTWAGDESLVHIHIPVAIFLGGAITAFPLLMVIAFPGRQLTRHVIAIAQMLTSALLIHLSGGRIETHFHVFGSLAFLSFYRDWKILISASAVVAIDHFIRGIYWPESVYGIITPQPWRWLEHAAWVIFEDTFLIVSILQGKNESKEICHKQATLESINKNIERFVKEQANKLIKNEERFRSVIETSHDAIISADETGKITSWNIGAKTIFEYEEHEAIGKPIGVIIPERFRELHDKGFKRYIQTNDPKVIGKTIELIGLKKDKKEFPIEISLDSYKINEKIFFTAIIRDITERKLSEEKLKTSEEQFRIITENMQDLVSLVDLEGRRLYSSPSFKDLLGKEEDPNSDSFSMIHPHDKERVKNIFLETVQSGIGAKCTYRLISHDGKIRIIESISNVIKDSNGKTNKVLLVSRDITDHIENQNALKNKTEQLTAISLAMTSFLETKNFNIVSQKLLSNALKQTNSEYGFIGILAENGTSLRVMVHEGIKWDKVIGKDFYENAVETYKKQGYLEFKNFNNLFGKVITTGKPVVSNSPSTDPRSGGLPPGHPTLKHFLGVPILNKKEVVGIIGVANKPNGYTGDELKNLEILCDAAAIIYDNYNKEQHEKELARKQREAEQELLAAQDQLIHSKKMAAIGQLGAGIAHELNNPLMGILNYVQYCHKHTPEGDKKRVVLEDAILEINRCVEIIKNLLSFSHTKDSSKDTLTEESCDVLIERVLKILSYRIRAENIIINHKKSDSTPKIKMNNTNIQQVFLNLITNAMDATKDKSTRVIDIETVPNNGSLEITIRDNGMGIPKEIQDKIFDPFFTTKEVGVGTGLGLSVCHNIIKKHNGNIIFKSEVGKGTEFKISLPITS